MSALMSAMDLANVSSPFSAIVPRKNLKNTVVLVLGTNSRNFTRFGKLVKDFSKNIETSNNLTNLIFIFYIMSLDSKTSDRIFLGVFMNV